MRITSRVAAAGVALTLLASACSGSSRAPQPTAPVTTPTTISAGVDPNAPEIVEPGDIPDNKVFIRYTPAGGGYTIKVPEGLARTEAGSVVTFTDKYNTIELHSSLAASAPTVDSVPSTGWRTCRSTRASRCSLSSRCTAKPAAECSPLTRSAAHQTR